MEALEGAVLILHGLTKGEMLLFQAPGPDNGLIFFHFIRFYFGRGGWGVQAIPTIYTDLLRYNHVGKESLYSAYSSNILPMGSPLKVLIFEKRFTDIQNIIMV